ncbi:hypothetical protein K505DRAFT_322174 [Melanomma pulvis-pyrius CBS 109.77]|uniref:Uncharacterized protein n=1 Tax=Melanomma pulvis-pyrius CBS 109.77 TaxID=1314802 RepID=A0A6A6XNT8_9PLEO|nr:hypothetical protein K505DRAFT_322174 [Melanomma pulvis-pyrius CBS 109.77]
MALQPLRTKLASLHAQYHDLLEASDFSTPTWLAFGAILHILSAAYLPLYLGTSIPLLWIAYRWLRAAFTTYQFGKFPDIRKGKWVVKIDEREGPREESGVVMFVLGARMNHPFGKLAPGMAEVGVSFENMWVEAEKNRLKWGYLGRTATLVDTSDSNGTTWIWLSYWSNVKGLQAFSTSAAHLVGQMGHEAGKYPYAGILHETYYAPKGNWEPIYVDMPPWGLGTAKFMSEKEGDRGRLLDTLVPNTKGSNMFSRMGWNSTKELKFES